MAYFVTVLNTETPPKLMSSVPPHSAFLLSLALAFGGCGAPADDDDSGAAPLDDDDTTPPADLFAVEGLWQQPDGGAVEGIAVTVSTEFCIADITDEAGAFRVEDVSPGPKRLITYGSTAEYRWPSVSFAFDAPDDGADFSFGSSLVLPPLDAGVPVDPKAGGSVVLAAGPELAFEAGALELAPLTDPLLRSGALDPGDAGWFSDLPAGALVVFAVEPILSTFDPPATLTLPIEGADDGDLLGVWSIDYDAGLFVQEGTLLAQGGVATTDTGGISNLGWHVVAPLEVP